MDNTNNQDKESKMTQDETSSSSDQLITVTEGPTSSETETFQYKEGERYSGDNNFPKKWRANLRKKILPANQLVRTVHIDADNLLKLKYTTTKVREHSTDPLAKAKGIHRSILNFATSINAQGKTVIKTKGVMIKVCYLDVTTCGCVDLVNSADKLFPHAYKLVTNCPNVAKSYNIQEDKSLSKIED